MFVVSCTGNSVYALFGLPGHTFHPATSPCSGILLLHSTCLYRSGSHRIVHTNAFGICGEAIAQRWCIETRVNPNVLAWDTYPGRCCNCRTIDDLHIMSPIAYCKFKISRKQDDLSCFGADPLLDSMSGIRGIGVGLPAGLPGRLPACAEHYTHPVRVDSNLLGMSRGYTASKAMMHDFPVRPMGARGGYSAGRDLRYI